MHFYSKRLQNGINALFLLRFFYVFSDEFFLKNIKNYIICSL